LSVPKNTIYFLCLIYLLPVNFFPIPSFLLHLLVTVKNAHRKTQPISSQSSHKKHIYCCTFGSFLREIKIPKQDPTSPYPVSPSPDPAQREWREQEGKLSGERGMRTGDEEQISDRRERTERERTGEWWWCPAPWICDGVLLLQRTGEWLERTERERTGEWWWCPAPWICDGVLLLQKTGEWLERTKRERTGEWWWCPAPWICDGVLLLQRTGEWLERTKREQGKRDNRERAREERQTRENEQWDEKSQGNEGISETKWGEWEGNDRGIWETEWDGNDSGMKPNERRNRMMMRWCL